MPRLLAVSCLSALLLCIGSAQAQSSTGYDPRLQLPPDPAPVTSPVPPPWQVNAPVLSEPPTPSPDPNAQKPAEPRDPWHDPSGEPRLGPLQPLPPPKTAINYEPPPKTFPTPTFTPQQAAAAQATPHADAWIKFESERDVQTRRGEKLFFPLALAAQAGLGIAASTAHGLTNGSRIALGVAGGLTAATILPTMLSGNRNVRRAWFGVGSAVFALGLGASLLTLDLQSRHHEEGSRHQDGRYLGVASALQGVVMLPIGLMQGFPDEDDYKAYWLLPPEERPAAAARILRQIDRFEQRSTAWLLAGSLAAAVVMSAGVLAVNDRTDRRQLAAWSFLPLGTALIGVVPRLFAGSRIERYATGDKPRRLPFNFW